jgi:hypothetical protein
MEKERKNEMRFAKTQLAKYNSGAAWRRFPGLAAILTMAPLFFTQIAGAQDAFLPSPVRVVSTVPSNGDVNPYGVAFVPNSFPSGTLQPGDILVSNFNNNQNLQGTGTTIVRIPQSGSPSLFFQATPAQQGLSTALGILRAGYIVVGSFPSLDGTCGTASAGSLLIVNGNGNVVSTVTGNGIDGPWDMTIYDLGASAQFFVANGLSGTVIRLDYLVTPFGLTLRDSVVVASGYRFQCDPATFVDAPTGLVYDAASDTLFVASTLDNAVFAVPHAGSVTSSQGTGTIIYQDPVHLHGALAMAKAPNGHLLVTNNDVINADPNQPSEIVEFTTAGQFVKEISVDPNLGGSFGLNVGNKANGTATLAAVDDNTATLIIWPMLPIN